MLRTCLDVFSIGLSRLQIPVFRIPLILVALGCSCTLAFQQAAEAQGISPASPSKENIYSGGKLIATEQPGSGVVPSPPTGTQATANSHTQITVTWTDTSNYENGFIIERKTGVGGSYGQVGTVAANIQTFVNTNLSASTTYFYRIAAYNGAGNSGYSPEASATTLAQPPPSPPTAPSGLTATKNSSTQITLNWVDNSSTEDGFRIERKVGQGGTYSLITTVGAGVTSYPNPGLADGTVYYYRVYAYNGAGNSGYSNEANACTGTLSGTGTYDGSSANIVYSGGWLNTTSYPLSYQTSLKYHTVSGNTATFSFSGDNVTYMYTQEMFRGIANITIDGISKDNLDCYAPYRLFQAMKTYSGLGTGNHTLVLTLTGTKNASSGSTQIDLDAFVVNITAASAGTYDDQNGLLKFSGPTWNRGGSWPSAYAGTTSYSNTTQELFTFAFTGTQLTYYYAKADNRGMAAVTIDGVYKGLVDLYSATIQWQQSTTFSGLGSGIHNVQISVSGDKNGSAVDTYIDADKLLVQ